MSDDNEADEPFDEINVHFDEKIKAWMPATKESDTWFPGRTAYQVRGVRVVECVVVEDAAGDLHMCPRLDPKDLARVARYKTELALRQKVIDLEQTLKTMEFRRGSRIEQVAGYEEVLITMAQKKGSLKSRRNAAKKVLDIWGIDYE